MLSRLKIQVGDLIKVGEAALQVRAVIAREPDKAITFATAGPRLMISTGALPATELVQTGSLGEYTYNVRLTGPETGDQARERLRTVPDTLGLPLIVKPPREGSSIGITKVTTADHDDRNRATFFRSGTCANRQRQHTGDQRQSCHQNRAQTVAVRLDNGVVPIHALGSQTVHVVNLQNGVFLDHAEQHQNSQRRI